MKLRMLRLTGVLLLGGALAGCAEDVEEQAPLAPPSQELRIGLTEWAIETGPASATPGRVQILVTNTGATRHDLVVKGTQGSWATPHLDPGQQYELHIRTGAGETLELTCTLTGHHTQGMHTTLPVTDPA